MGIVPPGPALRKGLAAMVLAMAAVVAGAGPSPAAEFANATPIVLARPGPPPGCPPACLSEKAAPFPSTIAVSGLGGTVTDVNVTLRNLTYEFNGLPDADVLLVAPGEKSVLLMSDACGDNDNYYPVASPITLTFDDQAGAPLPADSACSSGSFRPNDDDDDGEFPFHVADGITDGPTAPPGTRPLADFNGIDPNGAWSLYVVDDYPNDPDPSGRAGQIGGGWALSIVTTAAAPPSTAATTAAPPTTRAPAATPTTPTTTPATTVATPVPSTAAPTAAAPTTEPAAGPTPEEVAAAEQLLAQGDAVPAAASDDGGDILPLVGAAAAVVAIGLVLARGLRWWGSRPVPVAAGVGGMGLRQRWRRRRLRRRMRV